MDKVLNLKLLKKSRLKAGDIFAMYINNEGYIFGRVINAKLPMMGGFVGLLYIYNHRSHIPEIDITHLTPDSLLLPPIITFPALWLQGYVVRIGNAEIHGTDLVDHCFFNPGNGKYFDEYGGEIKRSSKDMPCGTYGVTSLGTLDDQISDALNIKRAPLTEDDLWYISGRGEKVWLKRSDDELRKYSNYDAIAKQYPDVIERLGA